MTFLVDAFSSAASNVILTSDPRFAEFRQAVTVASHAGKCVSAVSAMASVGCIFFGVKSKGKVGAAFLSVGAFSTWFSYNSYNVSHNLSDIAEHPGTYFDVFTNSVRIPNLKTGLGRGTIAASWIIDPLCDLIDHP